MEKGEVYRFGLFHLECHKLLSHLHRSHLNAQAVFDLFVQVVLRRERILVAFVPMK